jgi:hypothetical protein
MGGWLISLIISFALRFGLAWLVKRFPWLPPGVVEILEELLTNLKMKKMEKKQAVREAKAKIKKVCTGTACPTELKG